MSVKGKELTARQMLLEMGVSSFLAEIAIPYMFMMPTTTDPDSASVIEIIRGLQKGLRRLGYINIKVSGIFDAVTADAVNKVSPPPGSWREKTWIQIYGDVIEARKDPVRRAHQLAHSDLGAYGPFPGAGSTVPGGLGATASDGGVFLTWGLGVRNKANCVPIDGVTKAAFKALQRQINRLGPSIKARRIAEDGILGAGTITALRALSVLAGGPIPASNCSQVATNVVSIGAKLRSVADGMGVGSNANPGPVSTANSRTEVPGPPVTEEDAIAMSIQPSGAMEAVKKYVPFLALAGGAAWYFSQQKGKRRR